MFEGINMETHIYPVYERFVHKINTRELFEFYITKKLPKGIVIRHSEPKEKIPVTELELIVQEKTLMERPFICVGIYERKTSVNYIYAIRKDFRIE